MTADGVSAGYIWRLSGGGALELVNLSDGTRDAPVTAGIAADVIRLGPEVS
ncbi:hypothetical protein RISW2_21570 [Roseivivax isoporae LMG 25204]|uniref:Uncharacterized protein n=1 Tax=Roseivivax isoporae LMG 25204 TaxID=1449351 RepID=X7F3H3_9RHOB|nr:hypothetical protein RISW2_21570 [Roseivivax isoporae LMG 25204]